MCKKTCSSCKWWKEETIDYSYQAMVCDFVDTTQGYKAFNAGHGAEVQAWASDDTGMDAALITGADFGCVNHETN